ncbi:hypothetical protein [uncultured Enterovirga sp.]|uniref:hypothetical protein n=1 Tax=uncultured Enterovirga sp. TaxID=2026352 RepID=UPI0035C9B849
MATPHPHIRILDEAKASGLLAGDKTAHVSIRTTGSLIAAAKERTGIESTTELALATLALPDPVSRFMMETYGSLGPDHQLDV